MLRRRNQKKLYRDRARSRNKVPQIYSRTQAIVPERNFSKLYLVSFIFVLVLFIYIALFSQVFAIKNIVVTGDFGDSQIKDGIAKEVNKNIFSKNILFFQSAKIIKVIKEDLKVQDLTIRKKLPNKLVAVAHEREASFVWEENEKKFLIDKNGLAFLDVSGEEGSSQVVLPKIKNNLISLNNLGDTVATKEFMDFISFLSENFNFETLDKIELFEINGTNTEITVLTDKNYKVFFDATRGAASQLKSLARVKEEAVKSKKRLEYIDLRIETRIFYK